MPDLSRFITAQEAIYPTALAELRAGEKRSHWMWFIFPQIAGLGRSPTARHYALNDLEEARAYLAHPVLGPRLSECAEAVLAHPDLPAEAILGPIDAQKLRSSATLFREAGQPAPAKAGGGAPFQAILDTFYEGAPCPHTMARLQGACLHAPLAHRHALKPRVQTPGFEFPCGIRQLDPRPNLDTP